MLLMKNKGPQQAYLMLLIKNKGPQWAHLMLLMKTKDPQQAHLMLLTKTKHPQQAHLVVLIKMIVSRVVVPKCKGLATVYAGKARRMLQIPLQKSIIKSATKLTMQLSTCSSQLGHAIR